MKIKDFSPHIPNQTGKPDRIALNASTPTQYKKALDFLRHYFTADFPNGIRLDYAKAKTYYHGNSKLFLSCFYNDMTGKYEIATTTKKIIRSNNAFFKYEFIGNLTEYANTL